MYAYQQILANTPTPNEKILATPSNAYIFLYKNKVKYITQSMLLFLLERFFYYITSMSIAITDATKEQFTISSSHRLYVILLKLNILQ